MRCLGMENKSYNIIRLYYNVVTSCHGIQLILVHIYVHHAELISNMSIRNWVGRSTAELVYDNIDGMNCRQAVVCGSHTMTELQCGLSV